jgi:hypothetical protein
MITRNILIQTRMNLDIDLPNKHMIAAAVEIKALDN